MSDDVIDSDEIEDKGKRVRDYLSDKRGKAVKRETVIEEVDGVGKYDKLTYSPDLVSWDFLTVTYGYCEGGKWYSEGDKYYSAEYAIGKIVLVVAILLSAVITVVAVANRLGIIGLW